MKKDKIKLYVFELIILIVLFIALFVSSKISRLVLSIILLSYALLVKNVFKKKKILRMSYKEVTLLMLAFGILYVGMFYLLGLFFYKFNNQMILFNIKTLLNIIIPYIIIIISSEIIRFTFLSQDGKIRVKKFNRDYSKTLSFIIMVLTFSVLRLLL